MHCRCATCLFDIACMQHLRACGSACKLTAHALDDLWGNWPILNMQSLLLLSGLLREAPCMARISALQLFHI